MQTICQRYICILLGENLIPPGLVVGGSALYLANCYRNFRTGFYRFEMAAVPCHEPFPADNHVRVDGVIPLPKTQNQPLRYADFPVVAAALAGIASVNVPSAASAFAAQKSGLTAACGCPLPRSSSAPPAAASAHTRMAQPFGRYRYNGRTVIRSFFLLSSAYLRARRAGGKHRPVLHRPLLPLL